MADEVTFSLDGREITAAKGELVIAAAEREGVYIPRFCYHPRMKPVGMCRMCLVEIDTGRGPALQPACMIPAADGMTVLTESEATKKAQDGVLEFLLINHPLDCPVCDKGGECPLQDQTLAFGPGESRFVEEKRHYEKPIALSPLVDMDRERCILCDRCTRFSRDVSGDPLISFIGRGSETQVNTFPDHPFASYFSGNTVQICPVGALLAKPYRFRARPWDLDQVESTCTACAVGCRMAVQSSANRLVRHLGVDVDPVNWGWLCDKGRFSFEAVNSDDRIGAPQVRGGDALAETGWAEALTAAAEGLQGAIDRHGSGAVAVIGGSRLTNEDAYAWSKLARTVLGTDNVDCQLGDGLPAELVLGLPRATIDEACRADVLVTFTADPKEELPVLFLRLRDAVLERGLRLIEVSTHDTSLTPLAERSVRYRPGEAAQAIAGLGLDADAKVVCLLGRPSLGEPSSSVADAAGALLRAVPGAMFLSGLRRSNVHGALDMGLAPGVLPGRVSLDGGRPAFTEAWGSLPDRAGLDTAAMLEAAAAGRIQGLVLLGADPIADFPDRDLATRALAGAGFVVAVDTFLTESVKQADVVLPAAMVAEKPGTTTNLEGRVSRLHQKVTPPGTARPDWMIAVDLAYRMGYDLELDTLEAIQDEIAQVAPAWDGMTRARLSSTDGHDGILAGRGTTEAGEGPPAMSATESPEIHAAEEQGGPPTVEVSGNAPGEPPEQPDESAGSGAQDSPEVAEAMGTDGGGEYSPGQPPEGDATAEAMARSAEASGESGLEELDPSGGSGGATASDTGIDDSGATTSSAMIRWTPSGTAASPPPVDRYSLRLVTSRRLYDTGTLVQRSPSLADLAAEGELRANPADLDRLGVRSGGHVRLSSSRTALTLCVQADPGVPEGTVVLPFNAPGAAAADLVDLSAAVTEIRLENV
jgi:NADH-quinone oxidoreductase subunit G